MPQINDFSWSYLVFYYLIICASLFLYLYFEFLLVCFKNSLFFNMFSFKLLI